jgi:hypothetical protein
MAHIITFVVAVVARLVGDRLSKWLNRHKLND